MANWIWSYIIVIVAFIIIISVLVYMYMMLMHESHVFELRVETKFEVCDPCGFLTLLM